MNKIIIDTETFNKSEKFSIYGNMVFDLGGVIVNEKKEILFEYNAIASDVYEDKKLKHDIFFTKEQLDKYDNLIKEHKILYKPFKEIEEDILNIINNYNINTIAAFNINFDVKAIKETSDKKGSGKLSLLFDELAQEDIWHMACDALSDDEMYPILTAENGKINASGNVSSNAEAIYCYITNNYSFVESHSALHDAQIEKEIYDWVLDQELETGKKFNRMPKTSCWRLVQTKKKK